MSRHLLPTALVLAAVALATGCSDRDPPTLAGPEGGPPELATESLRRERLAHDLALALADSDFRQYVWQSIQGSPVVEHKLQFQRFLQRDNSRALTALARAAGRTVESAADEAGRAIPLELYVPVPDHLARWRGDADLLVATARRDGEDPVAYDLTGRRHRLSAASPPATPVLALVPVETDFDHPPQLQVACPDGCGSGGGGGGVAPPPADTPGLYLTQAWFARDFEGWLKGKPEFELHILGPASPTDSTLVSYQCVGEHAGGPYTWDMNSLNWSGSALVYSATQMDAFEQRFPGRAYLLFAIEDDDTACGIRTDEDRTGNLLKALGQAFKDYKAMKDIKSIWGRRLKAASSGSNLLAAAYHWLQSNDDIIGYAIADQVANRTSPLGNWVVLDKDLNANGWLRLELR